MTPEYVRGRLTYVSNDGSRFYPIESVASFSWWSQKAVERFAEDKPRKGDYILHDGIKLYSDAFLYRIMCVSQDAMLSAIEWRKRISGGRLIL